jgi:hypothetical protein
MKRLLAGFGLMAVLFLSPALAGSAGAEVTGPCTAKINNVDVASVNSHNSSEAIKLDRNAVVPVSTESTGLITTYKVQMSFAGIKWTVAKGTANGNSWSKTVNVKTYSRYGTGLYKVTGVSSGPGACSGAALVKITGKSPFTTPVGLFSAVLLAGALVGLIHSVIVAGSHVGNVVGIA